MSDILLNGELQGVCSPELAEAVGLCVDQYEKRISQLEAENAKLREAAETYRKNAGHTAKCWGLQKFQGQVTSFGCICGHDALAALLEVK